MITPPSSAEALETALSQNPHLTSLPLPRADILSPSSLTQTSGTAEILRLPEVQDAITSDFLVLPCDLVCEIPGESLLSSWLVLQAELGGATMGREGSPDRPRMGIGGEKSDRRGGLGVWFDTRGEGSVKNEEADFLITAPIESAVVPPAESTLRSKIQNVVYFTTKDTLGEITEQKKSLPLRSGLLERHRRLKVQSTYRDAHTYLFPYWIKHMIAKNETMDSISEDVVGWWAKAGWQNGLGRKMGLDEIFHPKGNQRLQSNPNEPLEDEMDLASMSSTMKSKVQQEDPGARCSERGDAASWASGSQTSLVPRICGYIHPSDSKAPLIRRVDTAALLLYVSLRLAKLESIETAGKTSASPLAHASKVAYPVGVAQRCTISQGDCLLAENVTVESKCIIKESVIGANCTIKSGARLTRCVFMDGAVVGERCELMGCIIGRRAQIGKGSALVECEVQDSNVIPEETQAKGEKFMIFEGLETPSGDEVSGDVMGTEDETFDASQGIDMTGI